MSEQHTQGRIEFKANGVANSYALLDESGNWWMSVLLNGEQTAERQEANLRRLAACWNACEHMKTGKVEELATIGGVPALIVYGDDLGKERDELLEALEMVRDADDDCKRDGLPTIPPSARQRIDSAIANVTGQL